MSKKDKKKRKQEVQNLDEVVDGGLLSKRGWKIVGAGIGVVILGFITLTFTDPRGQNFASTLSPFLIIGGYALIGVGIITKDPA